jgi:hypothetical protein
MASTDFKVAYVAPMMVRGVSDSTIAIARAWVLTMTRPLTVIDAQWTSAPNSNGSTLQIKDNANGVISNAMTIGAVTPNLYVAATSITPGNAAIGTAESLKIVIGGASTSIPDVRIWFIDQLNPSQTIATTA